MMFSKIIEDLKMNFNTNRNFFVKYSKSNPNMIYSKINDIAQFVGSRYGIDLKLHFPDPSKIYVLDSYMYEGKEGVRILFNKGRLELLPGSIHIWSQIDKDVENYVNWILTNVLVKN